MINYYNSNDKLLKSTPHQTTYCRLSGKYQIRLVRACQKSYPTRKYLKNQKHNMKKHYQKADIQQYQKSISQLQHGQQEQQLHTSFFSNNANNKKESPL